MKSFIRYAVPVACLATTLIVACRDRSRENKNEPGTTTITGANTPSVANVTAVNQIADARCARELACNNVGNDKHYASNDVCVQKIRSDMRDDLNTKECPAGVSQRELDACVASIKAENCNNVIDKIERVAACRTSDLCLKTKNR